MRKLLLATVAGIGAWGAVACDANAQAVSAPNGAGPSAAPAPVPMSQYGTVSAYSGGVALPTVNTPVPGTVVVRLNGRIRFYGYASWGRSANNNGTGNKVNDYGFAEYGRLYPGFDGIAANGLKYGANLEIRQDAGGPAGGGTLGSISGENNVRAKLYFRRVWGYLGTDAVGTIRLGSIDGPSSQYLTGNFENFNDGGWNGDLPGFVSANIAPVWPFGDQGVLYTTSKIVYLSPALFGFDLSGSYEPTTANTSGGVNCNTAAPGCDNLSSTPVNGETARRRNTFDLLVRYRGTFGPVGLAATAGYLTGSHIQDNSGLPFNNNPLAATGARYNYDGLSVGDFGAAITIGGFSTGGHYSTGRWNGTIGSLVPKGLPDGHAYVVGASYTFGPAIVGAQYFASETAGDLGNAFNNRQRRDYGVAAGGTYSIAPGVSFYLSALYGGRKQNGFDFNTGAGVTAATGANGTRTNNSVHTSIVGLGTAFSW